MEEKKKGGKRVGAGRKPTSNPKETITIYTERSNVLFFGSHQKLKEKLHEFISQTVSGESLAFAPTTAASFDGSSASAVSIDEAAMFPKNSFKIKRSYENYQQLKIDCATAEEWQFLKSEILSSDNLTRQQKALLTN